MSNDYEPGDVYMASSWVYIFPIVFLGHALMTGNFDVITAPAVSKVLFTIVGFHVSIAITEAVLARGNA